MNKLFVGFDPSFNHSGCSIINTNLKYIDLFEVGVEIDKKSSLTIVNKIPEVNDILLHTLGNIIEPTILLHNSTKVCVGIEFTRAMTGWMTAELYALDYDLYTKLKSSNDISNINLYSNASLSKSLLGHKSSEKEKTIYLIEDKILPIFRYHGYIINKRSITKTKYEKNEKGRWTYKDTITDGCADSMIYALRQFILYSEDEQLKQDILEVLPGLSNMKEME